MQKETNRVHQGGAALCVVLNSIAKVRLPSKLKSTSHSAGVHGRRIAAIVLQRHALQSEITHTR